MYTDLAKFINNAKERIFNDTLMKLVGIEIKLKSGNLNEEIILPRYYDKGIWYNGEYLERCGMIKNILPRKALEQLKELVRMGAKIDFETNSAMRNWIADTTGINDCSLISITD